MAEHEADSDHPRIKVIPVSWGEDPDEPSPPATTAEQAFQDPTVIQAMSGTRSEPAAGFGPARFSGKTRWMVAGVLFGLTMMVVLGVAMYSMGGGGMPVFGRVPPGALAGGESGTGEPGTAVPTVPGVPGQTAPGEAPANVAPGAGVGAYPALAKEAACRANLRSLDSAIEVYYAEQGVYPSSLADVAQFAQSPMECPLDKAAYGYDPNTHRATCPHGHTLEE